MELGEWFLKGLKEYNESLSAVFDDVQDEIHLYYQKSGEESLAYSVGRQYGELYPELQRRILKELPMHDVLKRFGSGEAYDDYLAEEDKKRRAAAQKKLDDDRMARMKDEKWKWRSAQENARRGILTGPGIKMEIPSISVPINIPKEGESEK